MLEQSTAQAAMLGGVPCTIPNKTFNLPIKSHGYISYNNYDISIYGCSTTAIVLSQWACWENKYTRYTEVFLILQGDHRQNLIDLDVVECLAYFSKNEHLKAKYSDAVSDYLIHKPFFKRTILNGVWVTLDRKGKRI